MNSNCASASNSSFELSVNSYESCSNWMFRNCSTRSFVSGTNRITTTC